jgi:hypothetical protein
VCGGPVSPRAERIADRIGARRVVHGACLFEADPVDQVVVDGWARPAQ